MAKTRKVKCTICVCKNALFSRLFANIFPSIFLIYHCRLLSGLDNRQFRPGETTIRALRSFVAQQRAGKVMVKCRSPGGNEWRVQQGGRWGARVRGQEARDSCNLLSLPKPLASSPLLGVRWSVVIQRDQRSRLYGVRGSFECALSVPVLKNRRWFCREFERSMGTMKSLKGHAGSAGSNRDGERDC
jgi:hypothetical protein